MNIYVGNLAPEVTQEDLEQAFSVFGQVASATIIKDKFTGDPRGFGFVEMPGKTEAEAAIMGLREIKGRMVSINEARPREFGGHRGSGGSRGFGKSRDGGQRRSGWR